MLRRKLAFLWIAMLLAITMIGIAAIQCWEPPPPGVTRANFERLHKGMEIKEIVEIMGKPADHHYRMSFSKVHVWNGEEGAVEIHELNGPGVTGRFVAKLSVEENQTIEEVAAKDPMESLLLRRRIQANNASRLAPARRHWLVVVRGRLGL